jgi:hypothetical protein
MFGVRCKLVRGHVYKIVSACLSRREIVEREMKTGRHVRGLKIEELCSPLSHLKTDRRTKLHR